MTTLTEFILARIDEDEAVARAAPAGHWRVEELDDGRPAADYVVLAPPPPPGTFRDDQGEPDDDVWVISDERQEVVAHMARFGPARVLAECEAKRRVVTYYETKFDREANTIGLHDPVEQIRLGAIANVLHILATTYADHPDYDEAWRP